MANQIKQLTKHRDNYSKLKLDQNNFSIRNYSVQRIYYDGARNQVKRDSKRL